MPIDLRLYQKKIISGLRTHIAAGASRILIESMTGSGKTTVGAEIFRQVIGQGKRGLWIAHREELITQAHERLALFGIEAGIIKSGYPESPELPAQVASIQSLINRLDTITPPDVIVIDETHHAIAPTYRRVISAFPDAKVIGLTATPWIADGRGLGEVFEHMIEGPQSSQLIQEGFIVPAKVIGSDRGIDFSSFRGSGEYSIEKMEKSIALRDLDGDAPREFLSVFPVTGTTVVFCRSVAHATAVLAEFEAAGVPAAVLTGETADDYRRRMLADFKAERIRALVTVDVVSEGYDIPSCSSVTMLRKTMSLALFLQQVGRALRPADGKACAYVFDLVGNSLEHGHPSSDRTWSLVGETPASRAERKTEAGEDISVRQCPTCSAIHDTAPECPYCGHTYKTDDRIPKVMARKMRELEKDDLERLQAERQKVRKAEEAACQTLDDWKALARDRGNKMGWAYTRHKLRQNRRQAA